MSNFGGIIADLPVDWVGLPPDNSINISSQQFDENKIKYWLETADNDNPFYSSTTSRESILKRIKIMKSLLGINNE